MNTTFMLCKQVTPLIGDSLTLDINQAGIAFLNSGTNVFVDFHGFIFIGIAGFRKEFNFRKIEVVCLDKLGFQVSRIPKVEFQYNGEGPQDYFFLQPFASQLIVRFFTDQSPYRFILLLDNLETDSWFLQILKAKDINDSEIKINPQFINSSEKL
jgi:hypothetical protein